MSITSEQAIGRLSGIETVEDLRDLISHLDVTGQGNVTVLYSGGNSRGTVNTLVSQGEDIRIVDNTEAGRFHNLRINDELVR